ncbi:hypothetical protein QVN85_13780 [Oscillibacter valericigenes]|nr:hypothetical protein [Oscillibacter valericigenes]
MNAKKCNLLVLLLISMGLILTACGTANISNTTAGSPQSERGTTLNTEETAAQFPSNTNDIKSEESSVVQNTPNDSELDPLEYWDIDEFESWMEQQHEENQRLADSHDKSFYYKGTDGDYYCREWTQDDVDALYTECQEQLNLMKQGYQFTKSIPYDTDGSICGVFGPEANEQPVSAPGSTIITLLDGSTMDLGHFDTAEEATQAVEKYLAQQVKTGLLIQAEADKILSNGAVE